MGIARRYQGLFTVCFAAVPNIVQTISLVYVAPSLLLSLAVHSQACTSLRIQLVTPVSQRLNFVFCVHSVAPVPGIASWLSHPRSCTLH